MSAPSYNRREQPSSRILMTVVGDTFVIYAPPAFSDRRATKQGRVRWAMIDVMARRLTGQTMPTWFG